MMMMNPKQGSIWECFGSHKYVIYDHETKTNLADNLNMEKVVLPPFSIFLGYNHLKNSGAGHDGVSFLRYKIYIIKRNHPVNDVVAC